MKLDHKVISWIQNAITELLQGTGHGNVGIIFHIRDGKIEWTEKIKRETEKPTE